MNLTPRIVREFLNYNPKTGALTWKPRDKKWFKDEHCQKVWNVQNANKPAFTTTAADGRRSGRIFNKGYLAHRVIWLWMTGCWPDPEVDHKNHDAGDNRWENLHEVNHVKNLRNQTLSRANTTGHCGVVWYKRGQTYQAQIKVDQQLIYLGRFVAIEDAISARQAAEMHYGFSPSHGKRGEA
jgi:hypothetical protein